ncbi:MAG: CapA family protein [Bacilli bacterium]
MKKVVAIIIILLMIGCSNVNENQNTQTVSNNYDEILTYFAEDKNITPDFLEYIKNNYSDDLINKLAESLKNNKYQESFWHTYTGNSLKTLIHLKEKNLENTKIVNKKGDITLSFVGDVSLADNWDIMPKYDERKIGIYGVLDEEVLSIMNNADIMVANNEFTLSNRGTRLNKAYTFKGDPKRASIYKEMGVDLVSLANNHIYDYGHDAFIDTLNTLKSQDIAFVGAGNNIEEAKKPYNYIINGYKIAFLNATRAEKNIITPEATENKEGVFRCYDPSLFIEEIQKVKQESDYVVALIHWGKEQSHNLEQVQIDTGKKYIDAGADVLVGSHAHVLQGMEIYNGKLIAYNLGDFLFNDWTTETGILNVNIANNGKLSYKFIPCLQSNVKTSLLKGDKKTNLINKMQNWSYNVQIDENGYINYYDNN